LKLISRKNRIIYESSKFIRAGQVTIPEKVRDVKEWGGKHSFSVFPIKSFSENSPNVAIAALSDIEILAYSATSRIFLRRPSFPKALVLKSSNDRMTILYIELRQKA
jgi:hypothetical protein